MKRRLLIFSLPVLSLQAFTACDSGEREPDPTLAHTIISLSSESLSTRADLSESPALDNELINFWWVSFVDKNNKVAAIFSSKEGLSPCSEDEMEGFLPTGTYTAYAFANIPPDELKTSTGLDFSAKADVPSLSDIKGIKWEGLSNGFSGNIPMCGWKEINVQGTPGERFAIEVVRMLGKVEFFFTNRSSKDITLKEIAFGPLNKEDVIMMPDYEKLALPNNEGNKPVIPSDGNTETYKYSTGEGGLSIASGADWEASKHFYVKESIADSHPTGHFHFSLRIERNGKEEELLYAMTDNLTFINRNDYILIPVNFHDYSFRPEVLFYPPIGGYPPVVTEDKNEEYYIKFGTGGRFEISPRVFEEGDSELARGRYSVTLGTISGDNIFAKNPAITIDNLTGEIIGELSAAKGTAVVPLRMTVTENGKDVTFSRNLYIIRE